MALIPAKCTQCGAALTIDSFSESTVCPFCETVFIPEDPEPDVNFRASYKVTTEYVDLDKSDFLLESKIKAGDAFIKLGEYDSAKNVFEDLTKSFPYDYRGWLGVARALTSDFSNIISEKNTLTEIRGLYSNAKRVASDEENTAVENSLGKYLKDVIAKIKSDRDELESGIADCSANIDRMKADYLALQPRVKKNTAPFIKKLNRRNSLFNIIGWIAILAHLAAAVAITIACCTAWDADFTTSIKALFGFLFLAVLAFFIISFRILSMIEDALTAETKSKIAELEEGLIELSKEIGEETDRRKALVASLAALDAQIAEQSKLGIVYTY